jgi:hypothetical protein
MSVKLTQLCCALAMTKQGNPILQVMAIDEFGRGIQLIGDEWHLLPEVKHQLPGQPTLAVPEPTVS